MSVAVITGSTGLIGSEAATYFGGLGMDVVGIDNDMRREFFGAEASTAWNQSRLEKALGERYRHHSVDIRDRDGSRPDLRLATATASSSSSTRPRSRRTTGRRSSRSPTSTSTRSGTLNVLEATRAHAPDAVFIFTSTNKVYGDLPNSLPLVELETRWEIDPEHTYANGIREDMSIDRCCTACSERRRSPRTSWSRNTAATSGCGPPASAAGP